MSRTLSIVAAVLVAAVLAIYLLLTQFLDKDKVIELAAAAIKEQTGATLTVDGDLSLSFFPVLGVAFSEAAITLPDKKQPDLEIGEARIGVRLAPLFSGSVEVDSIAVNQLTARIESAPEEDRVDTSGFTDAELEAYYAQRRKAKQQAGESAGAEAALAVPLALSVSSLQVKNARIESYDPVAKTTSIVELLALDASDLNLDGKPIPIALQLRIPGEQDIDVAVAGELQVQQETEQIDFRELAVTVTGATAEPLRVKASGSALLARQTADLNLSLKLADMQGEGRVHYASFESPQIDADLKLNVLDPVLFALAGPEAAAAAEPGSASTGDEPLPLDALRTIDTRARLQVSTARFGEYELTDLVARLRAVEGVVTLSTLTANIYNGKLDARAVFNGRHNTAVLETSGGVQNLDLAAAMANAASPDMLSGSATVNWELNGRGRTANELVEALQGPIKLHTDNIVLHGTSVEHMLCRAVALTNQEALTATFPANTQFTEVSADIQLKDGRAALRPLRANLEHLKLTGTSDLNLLAQDFSATFKAKLSPTLEELDKACRVSKRLTAIDFPVNCKGSLAGEPVDWCKVDTEEILRGAVVNEGRRKLEKEAGKLLNKFFNNQEAAEPKPN